MSTFLHVALSIDIKVFSSSPWPHWQMSVSVSYDYKDSAIPCQCQSLGFIKYFIHWSLPDVTMLGKFVKSMYNAFKAWAQKGLGLGNLWRKRYDTLLSRDWNFWDVGLLKCLLPLYIINAQFFTSRGCEVQMLQKCLCIFFFLVLLFPVLVPGLETERVVSKIWGSCFLLICCMVEAHLIVPT